MESMLIWIITGIIAAIIFIPYLIKFRKEHYLNVKRKEEARRLGIDKPRAQFPFIDMASCIGCGSCVRACPEGDVLGVIFGKATVINGLRCVGHALCEEACPVGAIEVGLGDIKKRDDIPQMDDYNETNIPGLFIAGELSGLSLIRNAVEQGERTIRRIAERQLRAVNGKVKDVIIVGAGPAGLTSALAATKYKLSYLVLDQQEPGGTILQYPRRKLVMTQPVDVPLYGRLKKSEYAKESLLEIWQDAIAKFDIKIQTGTRVAQVLKKDDIFEVSTSGDTYYAHHVVLAMGRRGTPRKLGVPGEDLPKVTYQLVDAQSYEKKHILVVGGGDSAVEAAVGLARQHGNKVAISYRKEKFFRIKKKNEDHFHELYRKKKIRPFFNSQVLEIREDTVILTEGEDKLEIPNDFVFIFAGGIPPFKMLKESGILFGGEEAPVVA